MDGCRDTVLVDEAEKLIDQGLLATGFVQLRNVESLQVYIVDYTTCVSARVTYSRGLQSSHTVFLSLRRILIRREDICSGW